MALSCCVQLGNRDARHSQYSNDIKKNSVPLKEVLTRGCASTSRASCEAATTSAHQDAENVGARGIVTARYCRKRLHCSDFFDSCSTRRSRHQRERGQHNVVNGAVRGLRVANFGKKNIFVHTGMIARSRVRDVALVANQRPSIRNTRITLRASCAIALRWKEDAKMAMRRQDATRALRQRPSLDFRRSLTACGFALPPDDFIT